MKVIEQKFIQTESKSKEEIIDLKQELTQKEVSQDYLYPIRL
jgi:hypothetical protein